MKEDKMISYQEMKSQIYQARDLRSDVLKQIIIPSHKLYKAQNSLFS